MKQIDKLDLYKARHIFDHMVEEVHVWRVLKDETGNIITWCLVYANPPALKSWGKPSLDEIVNKTTDQVFGDGATEHYRPIVNKIMKNKKPHVFQDYFPNLNKYFRFTSVPLGDVFVTTGYDITSLMLENAALSEDNTVLHEHIKVYNEIEFKFKERTHELARANEALYQNINELRERLETESDNYREQVVTVSSLLKKQSNLVKENARAIKEICSLQEENTWLRNKYEQYLAKTGGAADLNITDPKFWKKR